MADESNGTPKAVTSTLQMTFDHATFHLDVKGEAPHVGVFIAMCQQALREFEAQDRAIRATQLAAQIREQQRGQAIVEKIMHRA